MKSFKEINGSFSAAKHPNWAIESWTGEGLNKEPGK